MSQQEIRADVRDVVIHCRAHSETGSVECRRCGWSESANAEYLEGMAANHNCREIQSYVRIHCGRYSEIGYVRCDRCGWREREMAEYLESMARRHVCWDRR